MLEKIKKLVTYLSWVPLVLGFVGYHFIGSVEGEVEDVWNAFYSAAALYFINPVSDIQNEFVMIAKLVALLIAAGVLISIMQSLKNSIIHFWDRLWKDSTAIYSNTEYGVKLAKAMKHGYLNNPEIRVVEKTNDHIIMFDDGKKNMQFFTEHKLALKNKRVYILLRDIDSSLLDAIDEDNIHFINISEIVARDYWKNYNLFDECNKKLRIAIIGYGVIGKNILKYGFINNIYSLKQEIEYHIWGCSLLEQKFLESISSMNKDVIVVHSDDYEKEIDDIIMMDRIILTEEDNNLDILQKFLYKNNDTPIYCYCEESTEFEKFFKSNHIVTFGNLDELLTEQNIKKDALSRQAKLFNYDYYLSTHELKAPALYENDMEREWKKLDGFKRESNIARADHYWIEKKLIASDKERMELEHIRWCRFHIINHWTYNEKRDNVKRHHPLLVPYSKLTNHTTYLNAIYDERIREELDESIKDML